MKNIVIVDDELEILEILTNVLEDLVEDSNFVSFSCPEKALDYIVTNEVDSVVSDIQMPKINGIELYKKSRFLGYQKSFIFLSGFVHDFKKDLLNLDQCFVLEKPARFDKLVSIINASVEVQAFNDDQVEKLLSRSYSNQSEFKEHFLKSKKLIAQKKMRLFTKLDVC